MKKQKIKIVNNQKVIFNSKGQIVFLTTTSSQKSNRFYKYLLKKSL